MKEKRKIKITRNRKTTEKNKWNRDYSKRVRAK